MEWDDYVAQTCIFMGVDENKPITILRNIINDNNFSYCSPHYHHMLTYWVATRA